MNIFASAKNFKLTILIILCFLVGSAAPRISHAQEVVEDPANLVENTINVLETTAQSLFDSSLNLKEYVLDPLMTSLAKQLVHQLTQSVVNWINSGFQGSPAFLTNPEGFFLDVADQATGELISQNGPLASLCSPFSLDIRLSLALRSSQRYNERYTCTLGTIIQNSQDAIDRGVTINGFMAGDFSQGGWPAFIALSTEPQNNIYGAYLSAESDLLSRISQRQASLNADLNRGRGFLSKTDCKDISSSAGASAEEAQAMQAINSQILRDNGSLAAYDANDKQYSVNVDKYSSVQTKFKNGQLTYQRCQTQTPGSVIADSLQKQLGAGTDELNLADEIDEVVNAAIGQLLTQVLSGGLHAASGNGPGDSNSAVNRLLGASKNRVRSIARNMINTIQRYKKEARTQLDLRQAMFARVTNVQITLDQARACWTAAGNTLELSLLDATTTPQIQALVADQLEKFRDASSTVDMIAGIENIARTATSSEALQPASELFSDFLLEQNLPTKRGTQDIKDERKEVNQKADYLNGIASASLGRCNLLTPLTDEDEDS